MENEYVDCIYSSNAHILAENDVTPDDARSPDFGESRALTLGIA